MNASDSRVHPFSFTETIRTISRGRPATLMLVIVTVAAFIGQCFGGGGDWQWALGIVPANLADASSLIQVGDHQLVPAGLTPISYMFLHNGFVHLLANMSGLWLLGILAEPVMGTKRFVFTYIIFGVITGIAIVAVIPRWAGPMVGASGAISGILGAFLALHCSGWINRRRLDIAVFLFESLVLSAVVVWFVIRTMPPKPDRLSSAAWHLIPFLLAWCSVRIWRRLNSIGLTKRHN